MILSCSLAVICGAGTIFLLYCLRAFQREMGAGRKSSPHAQIKRLKTAAPAKRGLLLDFPKAAGKLHSPACATPGVRNTAVVVAAVLAFLFSAVGHARSQTDKGAHEEAKQIQELRSLVLKLQDRVEELEKDRAQIISKADSTPGAEASVVTGASVPATDPKLTKEDFATLGFLRSTTINFGLDGYYGYNFNRPIGRVNLLRAYDVSSNSFSINQASVIFEQAADPASGRRFGARIDLQYGQATETLQGNAANELRPQVYRPLFQAYGTYVAPVGSGLTIDFGKWASALGAENNYTKDQINYSRSYYFNFLPFYHMGVRATYNLNPKLALSYWLVNGAQQTEDFNGFKSQAFLFTVKPNPKVSWNLNYYFGQEQRDTVAVLNPGLPAGPTQPGLATANIVPAPNGREHIFDTYVSWNATPALTLVAEADYVINRTFAESTPGHVDGGAAYIRYQLTPKWAFATRAEYLSDRGGLFSGISQALKENTFTGEYKFAEGFLMRTEYRRDFSNRPFFLTDTQNKLKKEQNTATVGLVWWMGKKEGAW